jgi:myo-inositol-1(or 4)-monophosphatase
MDDIRTKGSHVDLVTAGDMASEALITQAVVAHFPGHVVYGEETANGRPPAAEWTWVVDPVDGTTNFAHAVPLFAVNIGVAHWGQPVIGVTHDPSSGRTFWAEMGTGAWLRERGQDRRLRVSTTAELRRSVLATGFPSDRVTNPDNGLAETNILELQVQGVRRLGSAALDMAWVAAGWLDGFWELRLKPWDCAAGAVLVREAGGLVTDYAGQPWQLDSDTFVASNPALHPALLAAIAAARGRTWRQSISGETP